MGEIKNMECNEDEWKKEMPYFCWLAGIDGLGNRTRMELTAYAGSPKAVYELGEGELREVVNARKLKKITEARERGDIWDNFEKLKRDDIQFYPIYHPSYPQRLKQIGDAPYGIYVLGRLPEKERASVAVIGARQCSEYGYYMAKKCGKELAEAGIDVISGMARGIDGISQLAAIQNGGRSYGVLGCGVDVCYPAENRLLYEALKERGGLISEYAPGTQPRPQLFPPRNRVISGLADVVLIVEAREKSGTVITADMALEQGKEVYVVPGRITDCLSEGCNMLLKQGAGVFTSIQNMICETGLEKQTERTESKRKEEKPEEILLAALDFYPKSREQLMEETGLEYKDVICLLTKMCMEESVIQVSAGQYVRRKK